MGRLAMSRARSHKKNFKGYLSKFEKMMMIREDNAKAIADAGVELPERLKATIVRPRRDYYGKPFGRSWKTGELTEIW